MHHRTLIALTLTGLALNASADHRGTDLSYDLLEYRYQETELDSDVFDIEGDGYMLNGSLEISPSWHLFGGFDKLTFDDGIELQTRTLGVGWVLDVGANTDFVLRAGLVDAEFNTPSFEDDDDGVVFSAGIRSLVRDDIELYGNVSRFQFDELDDEESVTLGLDFYFSDSLAVGPAINWIEDTTTVSIGGKFYF